MIAARVRITDLIDADAGSPRYCGHSIGRVIEVPMPDGATESVRYVRIDRIERSGERVYGLGVVVPPTQAVKTQARWDVKWGNHCAPNPAPAAERKTPSAPTGTRVPSSFADIDAAAAAIVAIGYRELAKRNHPDAGGSHAAMSLITQAHKQLKQILDLAKGGTI